MVIDHPITLIPQTAHNNCWVAATSMLLGDRTIPSDGVWVGPGGGLKANDPPAIREFARIYGLNAMMTMESMTTATMEPLLRRGAFMIISGVAPRNGVIGTHAMVIAGLNGELFHAFDPEPINRGSDVWVTMAQFSSLFPFNSFWTFQKI